jgi:hypothetical protein
MTGVESLGPLSSSVSSMLPWAGRRHSFLSTTTTLSIVWLAAGVVLLTRDTTHAVVIGTVLSALGVGFAPGSFFFLRRYHPTGLVSEEHLEILKRYETLGQVQPGTLAGGDSPSYFGEPDIPPSAAAGTASPA